MSDHGKWIFRVHDMLDSIVDIAELVKNYSDPVPFSEDRASFRAVERYFQIIAEASKHIPQSVKDKHSDVEWQKIINMRNFIVHEYGSVDEVILWNAVQNEMPSLKAVLEKILDEYEDGTS